MAYTKAQLDEMKGAELKEICADLGLKQRGKKEELVERILNPNDPDNVSGRAKK